MSTVQEAPGSPGVAGDPSAPGKIFKAPSGSVWVFLGEFFTFLELLFPYL